MRVEEKNVLQAFSRYQMVRVWLSFSLEGSRACFCNPLFAKPLDCAICPRWLIGSHHQAQSQWFVVECNMKPKPGPIFHQN